MRKTSFLLAGALSLCTLAVAGNKTYDISVAVKSKAGSLQLPAGNYKLKVVGSNAIFTDPGSRKTFTAPIKVETGNRKFNFTAVETSPEGAEERITGIELGGSNTTIEFDK
jgi:hypothetical protein